MTNSSGTKGAPLHAALSPFGEPVHAEGTGDRLPGILAGNEALVGQAVVNMVLVGGGLMLSGTRDGGAIGVHVFWGKVKESRYAASPEALSAILEAVAHWVPAKPVPMRLRASQDAQARR